MVNFEERIESLEQKLRRMEGTAEKMNTFFDKVDTFVRRVETIKNLGGDVHFHNNAPIINSAVHVNTSAQNWKYDTSRTLTADGNTINDWSKILLDNSTVNDWSSGPRTIPIYEPEITPKEYCPRPTPNSNNVGKAAVACLAVGAMMLAMVGIGATAISKAQASPANQYEVCEKTNPKTKEGRFCRVDKYHAQIQTAEQKYQLTEGILTAIAMVESEGDPLALNRNYDGSAGLLQLQPEIAMQYGINVFFQLDARTGNTIYGHLLKDALEDTKNNKIILSRLDDRFSVEKSADVAGHYLSDLTRTMSEKAAGAGISYEWRMAVEAYNVGPEKAMKTYKKSKYVDIVEKYFVFYNQKH